MVLKSGRQASGVCNASRSLKRHCIKGKEKSSARNVAYAFISFMATGKPYQYGWVKVRCHSFHCPEEFVKEVGSVDPSPTAALCSVRRED